MTPDTPETKAPPMRKCDECGKQYVVTSLVKCKECGKVLCPQCRTTHKCGKAPEAAPASEKAPKRKLPKGLIIGIIVLAVVILGGAGFLIYLNIAPIDVTIETVPDGAQVSIDGVTVGTAPLKTGVSPKDKHTITVEKAGYNPWYGELTPERFGKNEITANLEPLVPTLTITSKPDGAAVYLNEKYIGQIPLKNYEVAIGTHTIRLDLAGYSDWYDTVTVSAGERKTIEAELVDGTSDTGSNEPGKLTVTTSPDNATVSVDGEIIGVTPITAASITPKKTHAVSIEKPGYMTFKTMVTVGGGGTKTINTSLTQKPGWIIVQSVPGSADVYIDNAYAGFTVFTSDALTAGVSHTIRVEKKGYYTWTETVTLEPGETRKIIADLETKPAVLKVTSEPSGAKVYLGNQITEDGALDGSSLAGVTPFELNVRPGLSTTIRVEKAGYYTWPDMQYYDWPPVNDPGWSSNASYRWATNLNGSSYGDHTYYVSVNPGETKELHAVLKEKTSILRIITEPVGAMVYIDDVFKGKTPLENLEVTGNVMHTVSLQKDGYHTKYFTVKVEGGKSQLINETLTPVA